MVDLTSKPFLPKWMGWPYPVWSALKKTPEQDYNYFSIMYYYIISTKYQKIGDPILLCYISGLSQSVDGWGYFRKHKNPFYSNFQSENPVYGSTLTNKANIEKLLGEIRDFLCEKNCCPAINFDTSKGVAS